MSDSGEWGVCQAAGCTLQATIKMNGSMTCGHHFQVFDHDQQMRISNKIGDDKIRQTYIKVTNSPSERWVSHWLPMLLNAKTPELRPVEIAEGVYETQNVYLNRLYRAMDQSIQGLLEVR